MNVRLFISTLFGSIFTEKDDVTVAWLGKKNGEVAKDGPDATKSAASHVWEEGEDTMKIKDVLQDIKRGSFEGKGTEKE